MGFPTQHTRKIVFESFQNFCLVLGSLPKKENEWRRGRSSWSSADSSRLRESSLDTWSGSARQVGINVTFLCYVIGFPFNTSQQCIEICNFWIQPYSYQAWIFQS